MSKYKLRHVNKKLYDASKKSMIEFVACCSVVLGGTLGIVTVTSEFFKGDEEIKQHLNHHDLSYEELTDCSLLELQIGISKELYMCKKEKKIDKGTLIYSYTTLNDNTNIYNEEAIGGKKYDTLDVIELIKKSDNIEDYLVNFNYVKEWYTPKDVNDIMSKIYQVYSYSYNKVKYKVK